VNSCTEVKGDHVKHDGMSHYMLDVTKGRAVKWTEMVNRRKTFADITV
jgi:hypothetical protein